MPELSAADMVNALYKINELLTFDGRQWKVKRGQSKALSLICNIAAAEITRLSERVKELEAENKEYKDICSGRSPKETKQFIQKYCTDEKFRDDFVAKLNRHGIEYH
jgi:spore maturation protein CgeB